ncbi:hypothetical protein Tco_1198373 [Tanacetum coccineum]
MQTVAGDGFAGIKRRRRDQSSHGVRNMATALGCGRLKEDLESSTWRRRLDYKATPSRRHLYKYKSVFRWHDGTSSRNISSNSDTNGLAAVISKLDNLGRDMKKLKENVYAIQVGCQICEGPHLDKECSLNEEVKQVDKVKCGEFGRPTPSNESSGAKFRVGPPGYYTRTDNQTPSRENKPNLVEMINKYMEEATKRQAEQDEWLKTFCQNTKNSQIDHYKIIQKLESQVKTLAAEVETKVAQIEECKTIFANDGTPLYTPFYYSPKGIKYFSSNSGFLDDEKSETTKVKTSKVILEMKSNLLEKMINHYVKPYVPLIPFPNRLKQHAEETLVHKTMESLKKIKINRLPQGNLANGLLS